MGFFHNGVHGYGSYTILFWKCVDESHPEYERNEFTEKVEKYYQKWM